MQLDMLDFFLKNRHDNLFNYEILDWGKRNMLGSLNLLPFRGFKLTYYVALS